MRKWDFEVFRPRILGYNIIQIHFKRDGWSFELRSLISCAAWWSVLQPINKAQYLRAEWIRLTGGFSSAFSISRGKGWRSLGEPQWRGNTCSVSQSECGSRKPTFFESLLSTSIYEIIAPTSITRTTTYRRLCLCIRKDLWTEDLWWRLGERS